MLLSYEIRVRQIQPTDLEDGKGDHKSRNLNGLLKLDKVRKHILPRISRWKCSVADTLGYSLVRWVFELLIYYKTMNWHCFSPQTFLEANFISLTTIES